MTIPALAPRSPLRHSRGLAAVELAIVLPLFLMLMLATAELGRAIYQYNTLTKAVVGAARYLAEHVRNPAGVIDISDDDAAAAKNLAVFGSPVGGEGDTPLLPGLSTGNVTITETDDDHIQVSVSYAYVPLFVAGIPTFGLRDGNISVAGPLVAAETMRAL